MNRSIRNSACLLAFVAVSLFQTGNGLAEDMKMAVTTSFENSGLSEVILPEIRKDTDIDVQLIVVGTGQALKLGRAGDVDAILVHSRKAEDEFVAAGFAPHRREIMYNDFVLIGPKDDPAAISGAGSASGALVAISKSRSPFVSRGDDSGTNRKELALWKAAGIDGAALDASWYKSAGAGMGATLNTASGMNAYVLSDRATWLKFENKGDLKLLYSGDPALFNQYAFLPLSKEKFSHAKDSLARKLEDWLTSDKGQKMIGRYTINGEKLFTPNASKTDG